MSGVVVVGQVGRDLVLTVAELPAEGGSADVLGRQELLGGKGANQAVACRQLGAEVALVGVVGTDSAGAEVLAQAAEPRSARDPVPPVRPPRHRTSGTPSSERLRSRA